MIFLEDMFPFLFVFFILLFRLIGHFSKKKNDSKGGARYGIFQKNFEDEDDLVGDPTYSFLDFNIFHKE